MAFDFVTAGIELVKTVVAKFPDPAQRAAAQLEVAKLEQNGQLAQLAAETELAKGQMEINKLDAASTDKFASRWRPFIGWVCGIAFAYHFVVQPLLAFLLAIAGYNVTLPAFDMNTLFTVLAGMLGLGTLRSVDKSKGVSR